MKYLFILNDPPYGIPLEDSEAVFRALAEHLGPAASQYIFRRSRSGVRRGIGINIRSM